MKTIRISKIHYLLVLVFLSACSGGGGGGQPDPPGPVTTTNYSVDFSATHVIGATAAPDTVSATASLSTARGDDIVASGSVTVSGTTASAVTINAGYAGENGPVAVALTNSGGGRWDIPAGTEVDFEELDRLQNAGFYVSIDSPDGRLRGQILAPGWVVASFDMTASEVVPVSSATGTAKAGLAINPNTGFIRTRITLDGISDATSAGVRQAIAGANGDVGLAMEVSASDNNIWGTIDINDSNAGQVLTTTGVELAAKGQLYFSVESASNPNGALRAQITDDTIAVFARELTAGEVVTGGPPVTSSETAVATTTWVEALSTLGVAVNTSINDVLSVSVYEGGPGESGTLLFSLTPDVMTQGNWVLSPTSLSAEQAKTFENEMLYVSVESMSYPGGELRGQLAPTDPPMAPVTFTVNNSIAESATVSRDGGLISLDVPGVAQFALDIPLGALFSQESEFGMTSVSDVQGLPPGFTAIGAIKLEPSGAEFTRQPELEINLMDAARPPGQIVMFLTDDAGSGLTYLIPRATGNVSALLGNGPVYADIPHFSVVFVAVSDPEGPGIPDVDSENDELSEAELKSRKDVNKALEEEIRRNQQDPTDMRDIGDLAEPHLAEWEANLIERARNLDNNSTLDEIEKIFNEALRNERARDPVGVPDVAPFNETVAGSLAIDKLQLQIEALNNDCLGGSGSAQQALIRRLDFLNSAEYANLLSSSLLTSITPANFCLSIYVDPEYAAGFVPFEQSLSARVVDAQENDVDTTNLNSTIKWYLPGRPTQEADSVTFDWNQQGEFSPRAYFGDRSPILTEDVVLYGLPSMLGSWSATATGTTVGCEDDEDNGGGTVGTDFSITSQSIQGTSQLAFRIGGNGREGGLTVNSINISVTGVGVTETTVTGEASGTATYTIVENDFDEQGNSVTYTTTGTAEFNGTLDTNQFNLSGKATDDTGGCTSTGTLTLRRNNTG